MTREARPSRVLTAMIVACAALVLVSGCAGMRTGGAHHSTTPTPSGTDSAQTYPMPDLGPSPPPVPLTDAQTEHVRLERQNDAWKVVQSRFPDAVRPDVRFEDYVTEANRIEVMSACYAAAGIPIDYGTDGNGEVVGLGTSTNTEAEAVSVYECGATHPSKPLPYPSPEQLGYIYDYLVHFIVPCYEANGITNPAPPSRDDFVGNWPNQGWFPTSGDMPLRPPDEAALNAACPPTP